MSDPSLSASLDTKALKASGMLQQSAPHLFCVRLWICGGRLTSTQLEGVARIAREYADGEVHFTARQGLEIPNVPAADLATVRERLGELGIEVGGAGPRVRTVTACQGERCRNGVIPANSLGQELHDRFRDRTGLPHKFKFTVSGCTNGCTKPCENDLGIMGVVEVLVDPALCTGCPSCGDICPAKCITVRHDNGSFDLSLDEAACIHCGVCADVCPAGAWRKGRTGFAVLVGGKMGKMPSLAHMAFPFVSDWEQVVDICDRTLDFYAKHGQAGERFRHTLDRLGLDAYLAEVAPHATADRTAC